MLKTSIIGLSMILLASCKQSSQSTTNESNSSEVKNASIFLKVQYDPAFEEVAEASLVKTETHQTVQMLIKNNFRIDKAEDTFYFKSKQLDSADFVRLDTLLLQKTRKKIPESASGVDGLSIRFALNYLSDSNRLYFWSPCERKDSTGYALTKNSIYIFRRLFNDSVINNYFDDVESYMGSKKVTYSSKAVQAIDKLRKEKYHLSPTAANTAF